GWHRAAECKRFLDRIDAVVPQGLEVHLLLDNYSTHNRPAIQRWLLRHPRVDLHSAPTSSFWLNIVERWFSESTNKKVPRGVSRNVPDLEGDIRSWIERWNQKHRHYEWVIPSDQIQDSLDRC